MKTRLLAILLLALTACDQATIGPTLPSVESNWRMTRQGTWQAELTSVVAFASDDIYASHYGAECDYDLCLISEAQLFHFDGEIWSEPDVPAEVGGIARMWGRNPSEFYAIGNGSQLFHFDGMSWTPEPIMASRVTGSATNVFASFRNDIFRHTPSGWDTLRTLVESVGGMSAADDGSLVAWTSREATLWNGIEWNTLLQDLYSIRDAVCFSATNAFLLKRSAAGWDVMHWDGAQLTVTFTIPNPYYYSSPNVAFAGTDPSRVFVVSEDGVTYFFDGFTWSQVPRGTSVDLVSGTVLDTGELIAVGGLGKVVSFDGDQWQTLREAAPRTIENFWAESESRMILSDYTASFVLDGASLTETRPAPSSVGRMSGYSIDDMYAVSGQRIFHFDGNEWTVNGDSLPTWVYDIWAAPGGAVFAIGDRAVYRGPDTWERIYEGPIEFHSINGSETHVVATGLDRSASTRVVSLFDGTAWHTHTIDDYPNDAIITSAGDILVAGYKHVYRADGDTFVPISQIATITNVREIFELRDDRIAAFSQDQFAYYDGLLWLVQSIDRPYLLGQTPSRDILRVSHGGRVDVWEVIP